MEVLAILIPISLILGAVGLLAFVYTVRSDQYDDPEGDARRILSGDWDDKPKP
ncbi:cbb3-type cytochrome oxidase assembly protein CcoS [Ruegeria pomeroyi]|uniref:Cytochrome oxidase maturation protein, cbb3-type n=2 Tax=Ruegeria pomeroyi TaxID=89184 RepID=Q5LMP4_RUEPO|nr:cbb3-type cytochrome oxidase assembly protein CcoS [Ruegeria pomeroyi]HCE72109.1 cbb3-type cytochrome oxidase assembly protein CcoS [Ruegeria sp.]AAV96744.1 cytochrome oxidase maturation protein, cbb3-type [Ruegeria pomeroyi DSS-3]MCE8509563.1 cbb3-type cytochrome oxidase assembly protein CcoS [Ruegeria pomeroyi]NVK98328.1 cbb3-type cytochrome oxidase assembly protein CcoS [Ruegeria pomeroyi]NVL01201.1 cbb3-type cytochrome oxidase assembly protein CcoS [Ruegeria pomeroyi]